MVARPDAPRADLYWRRFTDGAVVYDGRHGRTHLLSTAAADVLELVRSSGFESSIDDPVARLLRDTNCDLKLPGDAPFCDAQEGVRTILAELIRLGLIESRPPEVPVLEGQRSAVHTPP